jgi:glycosyltransferase involved in cell wall biosynthesis
VKIGYLIQQSTEIRRPPFDGPANHVREVFDELNRLGHQVRLLARLDGQIWVADDLGHFRLAAPTGLDGGPLRLLERVVRRVQSQLHLPYANLFDSWRFALACCREFRDYDLLYERMSWMGYGGGLAARWLKRPLVVEYNGDHLHDLEAKGIAPQGIQRRLSLALMGWAIRQVAHVVATGEGWRKQFIERWAFDSNKVSCVENGTVLVRLLHREQLNVFRKSSNSGREVSLVYLGGFYAWHGVQILIKAFAKARQNGAPIRLQLIGSGVGLDGAKQAVSELGLEPWVTFSGQLSASEFAPLLADADIGLSPYCGWSEYSGLKLFDYKAAGLAIIASGDGGQPKTLTHGVTGWIVPPCDEAALTAAIVQLGTDANLRRRLGQAARLNAEENHGWDQTARQLEKVFRAATHGLTPAT